MFRLKRIFLILALAISLASCGGDGGPAVEDGGPVVEDGGPVVEDGGVAPDPEVDDDDIVWDPAVGESFDFPEPRRIVSLTIDTLQADLPSGKEDGMIDTWMTLEIDGIVLETYGEIGVQGSSTAQWPKKNWNLRFFADEDRTQELAIRVGNSIKSTKWVGKAEWVDPTLLRNATSFRLWDAMVKSRSAKPFYEVDNAWRLDQFGPDHDFREPVYGRGYPDNYPMRIEINGEFYGLSILLLGHDQENLNIDIHDSRNVYLEFDAEDSELDENGNTLWTKSWEKFRTTEPDGTDSLGKWIDLRYPKNKDITDEQEAAINDLGQFINGGLKEFQNDYDYFFDKTNVIDMMLFMEAIYDWDSTSHNIEMVTYDLKKWYFVPWDKDMTFGMSFEPAISKKASEKLFSYTEELSSQTPWYKTYQSFGNEVEARYADLRDRGVFSVENLTTIMNGVDKQFSAEDRAAEAAKWGPLGRASINDIPREQMVSWFAERLQMLDRHFGYPP